MIWSSTVKVNKRLVNSDDLFTSKLGKKREVQPFLKKVNCPKNKNDSFCLFYFTSSIHRAAPKKDN